MPTLSQPVYTAPQPFSHASVPYDTAHAAAGAQPIYGSQNPPVPRFGVHVSRERLVERSARRRLWLAVTLALALAVVAICVALLVWLGQHPAGTLFEPDWKIVTTLAAVLTHGVWAG